MKRLINYLFVAAAILVASSTALAEPDYGVRVRLQGVTKDRGLGFSGVLEMPTLANPVSALVGAGVSHGSDNHQVALHLAALTAPGGKASLTADARGTVNLTDNVFSWFNLRLNSLDNPDNLGGYAFVMADYNLPGVLAPFAVGVETENRLKLSNATSTELSVGPNAILNLSPKTRLEFAYQVHQDVDNQVWARVHAAF